MKHRYFIDFTHSRQKENSRQWESACDLKPMTEALNSFPSVVDSDDFKTGVVFVHINDFLQSEIYSSLDQIRGFFSKECLRWGIVYVTGGDWRNVEQLYIAKKSVFSNVGNGNEHHLLCYPISTTADKAELETKLSRYLANDDPCKFELLYENNEERDRLIAFRLLLDGAIFFVSPGHEAFGRVSDEVRRVAEKKRDGDFWRSFWQPVAEFALASLKKPLNMKALNLPEKEERALAECVRHVAERLSKGGDGKPDPGAKCVNDYLAERFPV